MERLRGESPLSLQRSRNDRIALSLFKHRRAGGQWNTVLMNASHPQQWLARQIFNPVRSFLFAESILMVFADQGCNVSDVLFTWLPSDLV